MGKADARIDMTRFKHIAPFFEPLLGSAVQRGSWNRVHGEQVHMAYHPTTKIYKSCQVVVRIVDILDEQMLKGNSSARRIDVSEQRLTEHAKRLRSHLWHEGIAYRLDCRVERYCQNELLRLCGQALYAVNQAAGGYRDMASPDVEPLFLVQLPHSCQSSIVVEERLALAHCNDIRHASPEVGLHRMHLINYLVGSEAPAQAFVASSAESALHRTPCLGGNANGQASSFLVP